MGFASAWALPAGFDGRGLCPFQTHFEMARIEGSEGALF